MSVTVGNVCPSASPLRPRVCGSLQPCLDPFAPPASGSGAVTKIKRRERAELITSSKAHEHFVKCRLFVLSCRCQRLLNASVPTGHCQLSLSRRGAALNAEKRNAFVSLLSDTGRPRQGYRGSAGAVSWGSCTAFLGCVRALRCHPLLGARSPPSHSILQPVGWFLRSCFLWGPG